MRVRPATIDDVAELADLVHASDPSTGTFSGRPLQDASVERLRDRLTAILGEGRRSLLVACDGDAEPGAGGTDTIVGMLAACSDEIGAIDLTPVLHVTHLMVRPGHRRRGTGRALLAAAVHLADEAGLENVLATTSAGSREGNRYLARIGFAPLVLNRIAPTSVLRRSLGMTDVAGRVAVLRRARIARAQRSRFGGSRAVGHGA